MEFESERKGYNVGDVRAFLAQLAKQFEELEAQKNESEKNMLVLADKIEEYRSKDDRISAAMISTQKVCDGLIRDAKEEAEKIIRTATAEAKRMRAEAVNESNQMLADASMNAEGIRALLESKRQEYALLQEKTRQFKSDILDIYNTHLDLLSLLDTDDPDPGLGEDFDISYPVYGEPEDAAPAAPAEAPAPEAPAAEIAAPTAAEAPAEPAYTGEYNDITSDGFKTVEIPAYSNTSEFDFTDSFTIPEVDNTEPEEEKHSELDDIFASMGAGLADGFTLPQDDPNIDYSNFERLDEVMAQDDFAKFDLDEPVSPAPAEPAPQPVQPAAPAAPVTPEPAPVQEADPGATGEVEWTSEIPAANDQPKKKTRRRKFPSVNEINAQNEQNGKTSRFGKLDFGSDFSFDL
ncbi:MAG: DivIVA domain-containing protein, partial [Oscillospiraceae bacterium]|nr:DivIVA domain-containing protein [Oscillospiraceae bacterium]